MISNGPNPRQQQPSRAELFWQLVDIVSNAAKMGFLQAIGLSVVIIIPYSLYDSFVGASISQAWLQPAVNWTQSLLPTVLAPYATPIFLLCATLPFTVNLGMHLLERFVFYPQAFNNMDISWSLMDIAMHTFCWILPVAGFCLSLSAGATLVTSLSRLAMLAAVGGFGFGIAHQISNILGMQAEAQRQAQQQAMGQHPNAQNPALGLQPNSPALTQNFDRQSPDANLEESAQPGPRPLRLNRNRPNQ